MPNLDKPESIATKALRLKEELFILTSSLGVLVAKILY